MDCYVTASEQESLAPGTRRGPGVKAGPEAGRSFFAMIIMPQAKSSLRPAGNCPFRCVGVSTPCLPGSLFGRASPDLVNVQASARVAKIKIKIVHWKRKVGANDAFVRVKHGVCLCARAWTPAYVLLSKSFCLPLESGGAGD